MISHRALKMAVGSPCRDDRRGEGRRSVPIANQAARARTARGSAPVAMRIKSPVLLKANCSRASSKSPWYSAASRRSSAARHFGACTIFDTTQLATAHSPPRFSRNIFPARAAVTMATVSRSATPISSNAMQPQRRQRRSGKDVAVSPPLAGLGALVRVGSLSEASSLRSSARLSAERKSGTDLGRPRRTIAVGGY